MFKKPSRGNSWLLCLVTAAMIVAAATAVRAGQTGSSVRPDGPPPAPFFDGVDEASKPVMAAARQRIEQVRKGDFTVKLIDETGKPVVGKAQVKLVRHAFAFGANLGNLAVRARTEPKAQKALDAIDALFNTVTVCGYWRFVEKQQGQPDWSQPDQALAWALDHQKTPRFHCVIYSMPPWLAENTTDEAWWAALEARIKAVAERYGRKIQEYDVINEMMSMKVVKNFEGVRQQYESFRNFPYFSEPANGARVLSLARRYLPGAQLVVLEARVATAENPETQAFVKYYQDLVKVGAPYDLVGYQGHYFPGGTLPARQGHPQAGPGAFTMKKLEGGLDLLASVGKPLVITEFNPPSRDGKREASLAAPGALSEEELAAWTVNFYTLAFSKPYLRGLTRWFVLDEARGVDAGVLRKDGSKKPEYEALRKLIKETWNTEWNGEIEDGKLAFHGFYGTYQVDVDGYMGDQFTVASPEQREATVVLVKHNGQ